MPGKSEEIVLKVPVVPDRETTRYRLIGQESGKVWGNITRYVNKIWQEGKECYKVYAKTEFVSGESLEETSILKIGEILIPISYYRVAKDKNEKILSDARVMFENELLELNSTPQGAITFCMRGGPFIPKSKITINLMSAERKRLKLYLETSKEKLKVPAGTSECYKMHIVPDSQSMMNMMAPGLKMPPGFGTFAQHLLPPTNRWLSQEEPHYMVKSEGSTDYVTASLSPSEVAEVMIEELVSIERGAT